MYNSLILNIKETYFRNFWDDMDYFLPGKIDKCIEYGCISDMKYMGIAIHSGIKPEN
jgi:hypothetical protein